MFFSRSHAYQSPHLFPLFCSAVKRAFILFLVFPIFFFLFLEMPSFFVLQFRKQLKGNEKESVAEKKISCKKKKIPLAFLAAKKKKNSLLLLSSREASQCSYNLLRFTHRLIPLFFWVKFATHTHTHARSRSNNNKSTAARVVG